MYVYITITYKFSSITNSKLGYRTSITKEPRTIQ